MCKKDGSNTKNFLMANDILEYYTSSSKWAAILAVKHGGTWKLIENENENENESLLIPAVQHDIYHRIIF